MKPRLPEPAARLLAGLQVLVLLLATALDELVTAWLGVPAVLPRAARWWRLLADEVRLGAAGVVDAEVIDDRDGPNVWR